MAIRMVPAPPLEVNEEGVVLAVAWQRMSLEGPVTVIAVVDAEPPQAAESTATAAIPTEISK
jgi:hypothetical protein